MARIFYHLLVYLVLLLIYRSFHWEKQVAIGWIIVSLFFSPAMIFLLLAVIFLFLFSDYLFDKLVTIIISGNEFLVALENGFVFLNNKNYQIEKIKLFKGQTKGKLVCDELGEISFNKLPCLVNSLKKKKSCCIEYTSQTKEIIKKFSRIWILLVFILITLFFVV